MFIINSNEHVSLFQKKDITYRPVKDRSSSQEEENATTVQNDQMTPYIRVWYHDVIIRECFVSLEHSRISPKKAYFQNYDSGYINSTQGHSLFILTDTFLQPD